MPHIIKSMEYGDLCFVREYYNQRTKDNPGPNGGIGILDNGAWVHFSSGRPITHPKAAIELLEAADNTGQAARQFQAWWQQKLLDDVTNAPENVRPIQLVECSDAPYTKPVFMDTGEEVLNGEHLINYFRADSPLGKLALDVFRHRLKLRQEAAVRDTQTLPRAMEEQSKRPQSKSHKKKPISQLKRSAGSRDMFKNKEA